MESILKPPSSDTTSNTRQSLREWVSDRLTGIGIWWYVLRSIEVSVLRSCGHVDTTRILRNQLWRRVPHYEVTECAECNFYQVMKEHREKGSNETPSVA
jgi:hypothetical protein